MELIFSNKDWNYDIIKVGAKYYVCDNNDSSIVEVSLENNGFTYDFEDDKGNLYYIVYKDFEEDMDIYEMVDSVIEDYDFSNSYILNKCGNIEKVKDTIVIDLSSGNNFRAIDYDYVREVVREYAHERGGVR